MKCTKLTRYIEVWIIIDKYPKNIKDTNFMIMKYPSPVDHDDVYSSKSQHDYSSPYGLARKAGVQKDIDNNKHMANR